MIKIELNCRVNIFSYILHILLSGLYTHHLEGSNLIIPRKVNHIGELISHNLTHHHDEDNLEDDKLHYHIELDDETLHLELE